MAPKAAFFQGQNLARMDAKWQRPASLTRTLQGFETTDAA